MKVTQAWLCIPPFYHSSFWIMSLSDKEKSWYWNVRVLTDFGRKLRENLMLTDFLLYRSWIVFRATWDLVNESHLRWIHSLALLFSSMLSQTKGKWNSYPQRRRSTPRSRGLTWISHLKNIAVHWIALDTILQWPDEPCLRSGSFTMWCDPSDALLTTVHWP